MASIYRIPVFGWTGQAGGDYVRRSAVERRNSSLAYIAGSTSESLRLACEKGHQRRSFSSLIRAAGSKQKKKSKEKKKTDKQWKFDELMLVWDDVFLKACENSSVATKLYELSRTGFAQYGLGCVLVEETVNTRPWGAASGFTFKSRYSSSASPELPSYSSTHWNAEYVPKAFILDPSKASASPDASVGNGVVRLVDQPKLLSVLKGMDRTRVLGLLAEPKDITDAGARDAGGEEPCDPTKDELVIMLAVTVDGQPAVGADVLKAFPTLEDGVSSIAESLWTLKLRDDLPG